MRINQVLNHIRFQNNKIANCLFNRYYFFEVASTSSGATTKRLTSSAAVKSARATYKRQMKQEKAAAAEEIEARKSSEVGEHDENITNHGENSGNQEE